MDQYRRCSKCGESKPLLSGFHRDSQKLSGYRPDCKACACKRVRAHQAEHRNVIAVRVAQRYAQNPEPGKARASAWYTANRERALAASAAWAAAHQGEMVAYRAAHYQHNRELFAQRSTEYIAAHLERIHEARARRRAREKGAAILGPVSYVEVRRRDRDICWLCKEPVDDKTRSYDHAVALAKGGEHSTRNVRIAHRLCNSRKSARDIPHQRLLF